MHDPRDLVQKKTWLPSTVLHFTFLVGLFHVLGRPIYLCLSVLCHWTQLLESTKYSYWIDALEWTFHISPLNMYIIESIPIVRYSVFLLISINSLYKVKMAWLVRIAKFCPMYQPYLHHLYTNVIVGIGQREHGSTGTIRIPSSAWSEIGRLQHHPRVSMHGQQPPTS